MPSHIPLNDIVEETPSGSVSRVASQPTLFNGDIPATQDAPHLQHQEHSPFSTSPTPGRRRGNSSVSRVDVDFFDPAGVQELRRTLTQQHDEEKAKGHRSSTSSDRTLDVKTEDEPFDFAKTLREIVRK